MLLDLFRRQIPFVIGSLLRPLLIVFLVEECEIVGVFLLTVCGLVHFEQLVIAVIASRGMLVLVGRRFFMVADAVVAMVTDENTNFAPADIVGVLVAGVTRAVLMAVLSANGCSRRGYSTLTSGVSPERVHLRKHVFPLADL